MFRELTLSKRFLVTTLSNLSFKIKWSRECHMCKLTFWNCSISDSKEVPLILAFQNIKREAYWIVNHQWKYILSTSYPLFYILFTLDVISVLCHDQGWCYGYACLTDKKMYLTAWGYTVRKRNFQMQNPVLSESLKSAVSQV